MQGKMQIDLQRVHRDAYLGGPGIIRSKLDQRSPRHILLENAIALPDRPKGLLTYDGEYVMTLRSLYDLASTGEGIPEENDLETLALGPFDRVPFELVEGTTLTLDEPEEDIRPDQGDEGSGRRRTGRAEMKARGVQERK
ncbi:hypothetical protein BHE74_00049890 [Ensete ventricosum]|nr:hypothetical protein BHE74_00049890 [Ensete ventricosum]RZR80604.1 hypothetical protein BHM03_00006658 [Ensete ventricosum]